MKHQSFAGRILCLVLTLSLLLSLAGCVTPPDPTTQATVPTTQAPTTTPTTVPTVPTEPTVPPTTVPAEPPVDANKLEYTLSQEDIDEFYRLLDETEKMAIAGEDLDAIDAISDQLDEQFELLDAQNSIAMILYYADMNDEALTQQHLDAVDIRTAAADAYTQSVRRIYLSETPARDMLFEDWTEQDIAMLLMYDERVAELQKRNAEIEVDYRATAKDDEKDLSKVNFDIDLYEAYARGFIAGAQGGLTKAELEYLPWGARLMTLECGIRFLTDYLDGDNYFRIHYADQNLDRCRTQFKLVSDMEAQFEEMGAVVRKYAK